jgi:hypothetical protein
MFESYAMMPGGCRPHTAANSGKRTANPPPRAKDYSSIPARRCLRLICGERPIARAGATIRMV